MKRLDVISLLSFNWCTNYLQVAHMCLVINHPSNYQLDGNQHQHDKLQSQFFQVAENVTQLQPVCAHFLDFESSNL